MIVKSFKTSVFLVSETIFSGKVQYRSPSGFCCMFFQELRLPHFKGFTYMVWEVVWEVVSSFKTLELSELYIYI